MKDLLFAPGSQYCRKQADYLNALGICRKEFKHGEERHVLIHCVDNFLALVYIGDYNILKKIKLSSVGEH